MTGVVQRWAVCSFDLDRREWFSDSVIQWFTVWARNTWSDTSGKQQSLNPSNTVNAAHHSLNACLNPFVIILTARVASWQKNNFFLNTFESFFYQSSLITSVSLPLFIFQLNSGAVNSMRVQKTSLDLLIICVNSATEIRFTMEILLRLHTLMDHSTSAVSYIILFLRWWTHIAVCVSRCGRTCVSWQQIDVNVFERHDCGDYSNFLVSFNDP